MISVVTPTFRRSEEVEGLLRNLAEQTLLPDEVILVDGADPNETATEDAVKQVAPTMPFAVRYIRHGGGTAIQRNVGIDDARGKLIALIDDDVRLTPGFLETIAAIYNSDTARTIGGVVGYRTNQHFTLDGSERWRWYRRLGLLKVFEPGRYDFDCGYPINNNMQPPFTGTREVDFMTTACAVWRREVFESGLRFDTFFRDYGVLEDAHFSLRAGRSWKLLQSGDAHCEELHSPNGRVDRKKIGFKSVVNYHYVFRDIAGPLTSRQTARFWIFQLFELLRVGSSAVRRRNLGDVHDVVGRLRGIGAVWGGRLRRSA
jgi:glycosyltransferase involved in cell wall biosynthesis